MTCVANMEPASKSTSRVVFIHKEELKIPSEYEEKYDEALEMLDDIIELMPDDLDAREKKAQTFILMNDWQAAAIHVA